MAILILIIGLRHGPGWEEGKARMAGADEEGQVQVRKAPSVISTWLGNPKMLIYPLVIHTAMENGPFIYIYIIDGLPIKNGDFPWLC